MLTSLTCVEGEKGQSRETEAFKVTEEGDWTSHNVVVCSGSVRAVQHTPFGDERPGKLLRHHNRSAGKDQQLASDNKLLCQLCHLRHLRRKVQTIVLEDVLFARVVVERSGGTRIAGWSHPRGQPDI